MPSDFVLLKALTAAHDIKLAITTHSSNSLKRSSRKRRDWKGRGLVVG